MNKPSQSTPNSIGNGAKPSFKKFFQVVTALVLSLLVVLLATLQLTGKLDIKAYAPSIDMAAITERVTAINDRMTPASSPATPVIEAPKAETSTSGGSRSEPTWEKPSKQPSPALSSPSSVSALLDEKLNPLKIIEDISPLIALGLLCMALGTLFRAALPGADRAVFHGLVLLGMSLATYTMPSVLSTIFVL